MLSYFIPHFCVIVPCVKRGLINWGSYKQLLRHACNPHYKRNASTASNVSILSIKKGR